jgi:two-component system NarL family response regulator
MKVLLADDHPLFLDALRNLLESRGIEVLGTAADGFAAVAMARKLQPDLVLMDIQMPGMDGLAALRQIKAEFPAIKVAMLTMSADDQDLFEAIKSGACGYLLKTRDSAEFFGLLADVERGEAALSRGLATQILQEFARQEAAPQSPSEEESEPALTVRQTEILQLAAHGLTYKEMGERLFISERTIKFHMAQIVERPQVKNRAGAIASAKRAGLLG